MASIVPPLLDLMADELVCVPGSQNQSGGFTPSGSDINLPCYISGKTKQIKDSNGEEITSSIHAIVGATTPILTVNTFRYTLPARYDPRLLVKALEVKIASDEDGVHHMTVFFP